MKHSPKHAQKGYSLIELSMVLVIIGLLVAGVLKGTELIQQARLRNIAGSFDNITIAIQTYQERYRALPGDDPAAAGRWPSTASNGNGDRVICGGYAGAGGGSSCGTGGDESQLIWQHLRSAGLLAGTGITPPEHPANGAFGVQYVGLGINSHVLCANNLNGVTAGSLDRQGDDGIANSGAMRGVAQLATAALGGTTPTSTAYVEESNQIYVLCRSF